MLMAFKGDVSEYQWLISKCVTQSTLLNLERKSIGVIPMTLNTFKKYSNENISGGFSEINRLRKELKNKDSNKKTSTQKTLQDNVVNCKVKLDEAERARSIIIRAYNDLNSICLDAISRSPEYQYDYKRHLELYRNYLSLALVKSDG